MHMYIQWMIGGECYQMNNAGVVKPWDMHLLTMNGNKKVPTRLQLHRRSIFCRWILIVTVHH